MIYTLLEQSLDGQLVVKASPGAGGDDRRVRLRCGALTVRLDVATAERLVDDLVGVLVELEAQAPRELRRDENEVRRQAAIREDLGEPW